jgi:hypothetical protein
MPFAKPHIDWNSAAMEQETTLSVHVAYANDDWREKFKREVATENMDFGINGWGEIFLIGDRVVVTDVTRGSERRLRDTLDCMVTAAERAVRRDIALRDMALQEVGGPQLTRAGH